MRLERLRNDGNPTVTRDVFATMGDTAEHYRQRAEHCRELAATARDDLVIQRLMDLASDLEEEADKLDRNQAE